MEQNQLERTVSELHRELEINFSEAVDVFSAIRRLGVYLNFRPLLKMHGAYLNPDGQTPGILINSNHPLLLQRYTAAHELGHFCLRHQASIDYTIVASPDEVKSYYIDEQERDANIFAALFLMPLELVAHLANQLGFSLESPNSVLPDQVMLLSTHLGVNYVATVNRLRSLGAFDKAYRETLLETQPRTIKKAMGAHKPSWSGVNGLLTWHHVVAVDQRSASGVIMIRQDQILQVCLQTPHTSGFLWELVNPPKEAYSAWDTEPLAPPDHFGAGVCNVFTLADLRPGTVILRFLERRPWQPDEIKSEFLLRVEVQAVKVGIDIDQLAIR